MKTAPGNDERADCRPLISAEARDALPSQAMAFLSGMGMRMDPIDHRFFDDLERLLRALGDIGEGVSVELTVPTTGLRRVITEVRRQLPEDPEAPSRMPGTRIVARTCDEILAQLDAATGATGG